MEKDYILGSSKYQTDQQDPDLIKISGDCKICRGSGYTNELVRCWKCGGSGIVDYLVHKDKLDRE